MTYERIRFTEYLDLDLAEEAWHCHSCGGELISAHESYKCGCLVAERDPRDIYPAIIVGQYTFAPDPEWIRILEFYCPHCVRQIETEYLPPGHPITHDIEIDVARLKGRIDRGELVIHEGRLYLPEDLCND